MIFAYTGFPLAVLLLSVIFRNYKKPVFDNLDKKEHPLRFLYPASARIYDLFRSILPNDAHSKLTSLMKQLYVRENVETEMLIYNAKKISSMAGILVAVCAVGMLLFITNEGSREVKTLERAAEGGGQTSYTLEADYGERRETVEITVDEQKLTEEEVYEMFDASFEAVISEMLGDNESLENVTEPLDLITSWEGISISWETEDASLIDYGGNISEAVEENEYIQLNLYATFTAYDISAVYAVPVTITGEEVTARELLIQNIYESIEENNSEYDREVNLPDSINGVDLTFRTISSDPGKTFFFLGVAAVIVLMLIYDRTLEDKIRKRREEMALDFSEIVFKLSLLYEAGLSIFKSWERIVSEYEDAHPKGRHFAYMEMRLTLEQIRNGAPEARAYSRFGKRCALHSYIKLGNILEQNLTKGAKGMKNLLRQEAREAFDERKRIALKRGEEAGTKMLIPMVLMLAVVIVIVAVPAFMSM